MSGIAGIVVHRGERPAADSEIQQMLARMSHRARDGMSWWNGAEVVLGHAWLNTTGEPSGGPATMAGGKLAISSDSRLDGREDLLARLGLRDRSLPDSTLILRAYLRWGEACPEYLLGDFAFAIWDGERRALFCARDHFGVKPFYYHSSGSRFVFASEIRPILGVEGIRTCVSEHQISGFLAGLPDDLQSTQYMDVFRLPARHSLTVTEDRVALRNYWQIEPSRISRRADAAEEFRHLFEESVRNRMRGTAAIGAMLSGGLDSSSIACVAGGLHASQYGQKLPTYSLVFDKGTAMDERPFIEAVLAGGQFDSHLIPISNHAPFAEFDRVLEEQEGTFLAPGLTVTRNIYKAAQATGTRVLLNGHGGDEVVSHGEVRLDELADSGQWLELWREVRSMSELHGASVWSVYFNFLTVYGPAWRLAKIRRAANRLRSRFTGSPIRAPRVPPWRSLVNADLAARTGLVDRYMRAGQVPPMARVNEGLNHRWTVSAGLVSHAFEVLDKAAANFGIEPRYPFWDKPLVEFCLALPAEEKLKNGWGRSVLRRAMEGILPPAVQWRRDKIDFKSNLVEGIMNNHRPLLDRVLGPDSERIAPYVNLAAVTAAYGRLSNDPAGARLDDIQQIWRSVTLSLWLRQVERGEALT